MGHFQSCNSKYTFFTQLTVVLDHVQHWRCRGGGDASPGAALPRLWRVLTGNAAAGEQTWGTFEVQACLTCRGSHLSGPVNSAAPQLHQCSKVDGKLQPRPKQRWVEQEISSNSFFCQIVILSVTSGDSKLYCQLSKPVLGR